MDDHHTTDQSPPLDLRSLKALSVLGRGAKGVAFLVRHRDQTLALKTISKSSIEKNKKPEDGFRRIRFELDTLKELQHPLLPKLHGFLSTEKIVGFAIEYCSGGDLNSLRKKQTEKSFSDDIIRSVLKISSVISIGLFNGPKHLRIGRYDRFRPIL